MDKKIIIRLEDVDKKRSKVTSMLMHECMGNWLPKRVVGFVVPIELGMKKLRDEESRLGNLGYPIELDFAFDAI